MLARPARFEAIEQPDILGGSAGPSSSKSMALLGLAQATKATSWQQPRGVAPPRSRLSFLEQQQQQLRSAAVVPVQPVAPQAPPPPPPPPPPSLPLLPQQQLQQPPQQLPVPGTLSGAVSPRRQIKITLPASTAAAAPSVVREQPPQQQQQQPPSPKQRVSAQQALSERLAAGVTILAAGKDERKTGEGSLSPQLHAKGRSDTGSVRPRERPSSGTTSTAAALETTTTTTIASSRGAAASSNEREPSPSSLLDDAVLARELSQIEAHHASEVRALQLQLAATEALLVETVRPHSSATAADTRRATDHDEGQAAAAAALEAANDRAYAANVRADAADHTLAATRAAWEDEKRAWYDERSILLREAEAGYAGLSATVADRAAAIIDSLRRQLRSALELSEDERKRLTAKYAEREAAAAASAAAALASAAVQHATIRASLQSQLDEALASAAREREVLSAEVMTRLRTMESERRALEARMHSAAAAAVESAVAEAAEAREDAAAARSALARGRLELRAQFDAHCRAFEARTRASMSRLLAQARRHAGVHASALAPLLDACSSTMMFAPPPVSPEGHDTLTEGGVSFGSARTGSATANGDPPPQQGQQQQQQRTAAVNFDRFVDSSSSAINNSGSNSSTEPFVSHASVVALALPSSSASSSVSSSSSSTATSSSSSSLLPATPARPSPHSQSEDEPRVLSMHPPPPPPPRSRASSSSSSTTTTSAASAMDRDRTDSVSGSGGGSITSTAGTDRVTGGGHSNSIGGHQRGQIRASGGKADADAAAMHASLVSALKSYDLSVTTPLRQRQQQQQSTPTAHIPDTAALIRRLGLPAELARDLLVAIRDPAGDGTVGDGDGVRDLLTQQELAAVDEWKAAIAASSSGGDD